MRRLSKVAGSFRMGSNGAGPSMPTDDETAETAGTTTTTTAVPAGITGNNKKKMLDMDVQLSTKAAASNRRMSASLKEWSSTRGLGASDSGVSNRRMSSSLKENSARLNSTSNGDATGSASANSKTTSTNSTNRRRRRRATTGADQLLPALTPVGKGFTENNSNTAMTIQEEEVEEECHQYAGCETLLSTPEKEEQKQQQQKEKLEVKPKRGTSPKTSPPRSTSPKSSSPKASSSSPKATAAATTAAPKRKPKAPIQKRASMPNLEQKPSTKTTTTTTATTSKKKPVTGANKAKKPQQQQPPKPAPSEQAPEQAPVKKQPESAEQAPKDATRRSPTRTRPQRQRSSSLSDMGVPRQERQQPPPAQAKEKQPTNKTTIDNSDDNVFQDDSVSSNSSLSSNDQDGLPVKPSVLVRDTSAALDRIKARNAARQEQREAQKLKNLALQHKARKQQRASMDLSLRELLTKTKQPLTAAGNEGNSASEKEGTLAILGKVYEQEEGESTPESTIKTTLQQEIPAQSTTTTNGIEEPASSDAPNIEPAVPAATTADPGEVEDAEEEEKPATNPEESTAAPAAPFWMELVAEQQPQPAEEREGRARATKKRPTRQRSRSLTSMGRPLRAGRRRSSKRRSKSKKEGDDNNNGKSMMQHDPIPVLNLEPPKLEELQPEMKNTFFFDDEYHDNCPKAKLDPTALEATVQKLQARVDKLQKQLDETQQSEQEQVAAETAKCEALKQSFAAANPIQGDNKDDLSHAVQQSKEIIAHLKQENATRRKENQTLKVNLFDMHQKTMRLEKATQSTLNGVQELEEVHLRHETEKNVALYDKMATCRRGHDRLYDELDKWTQKGMAEHRIHARYQETVDAIEKLLQEDAEKANEEDTDEFVESFPNVVTVLGMPKKQGRRTSSIF